MPTQSWRGVGQAMNSENEILVAMVITFFLVLTVALFMA